MKRYYNYILHPQDNRSTFTLDNPFSSNLYNTVEQAYGWAEKLLKLNSWVQCVYFRAEYGRKVYTITRENGKLIRGKFG